MDEHPRGTVREQFAAVRDPRGERTRRHDLLDIITIAPCAVICGADRWVEMATWGRAKEPWPRTGLALSGAFPPMTPSVGRSRPWTPSRSSAASSPGWRLEPSRARAR
jgi:hypothetical protein